MSVSTDRNHVDIKGAYLPLLLDAATYKQYTQLSGAWLPSDCDDER